PTPAVHRHAAKSTLTAAVTRRLPDVEQQSRASNIPGGFLPARLQRHGHQMGQDWPSSRRATPAGIRLTRPPDRAQEGLIGSAARHRDARRAWAWSTSGTLLDEAASRGDCVTASAAAAASCSVIFAMTAPRARLNDAR